MEDTYLLSISLDYYEIYLLKQYFGGKYSINAICNYLFPWASTSDNDF